MQQADQAGQRVRVRDILTPWTYQLGLELTYHL